MKKVIVGSLIGVSLFVGAVVAAHTIEGYLDRLQERLELSEEQKDSLRKIFEESEKKELALQKEIRALRQETREQFEAALNENQLEQLKEMRNDRWKGKGRHDRDGKRGRHWGYSKDGDKSSMLENFEHRAFSRFLDTDSITSQTDI